jgi:hypothetical protein
MGRLTYFLPRVLPVCMYIRWRDTEKLQRATLKFSVTFLVLREKTDGTKEDSPAIARMGIVMAFHPVSEQN